MKNKVKQIKKNIQRSIIAFMAMMMVVGGLNLTGVKAANEVEVVVKNEFPLSANVTSADGLTTVWWSEIGYLYINGELGFCVEPQQFVDKNANYSPSQYSSSQRNTIEEIAYVGWHLSNKTDVDYAATQFMIWEALGATINSHNLAGYETKKKQIQNKIDLLFNTKPSFYRSTPYDIQVGDSITLTDTNGVFNNYSLSSKSNGITVSKSGNKLTITATKDAPENATVKYQLVKKDCVGTSMLFTSVLSQDVVVAKKSDPNEITIRLNVEKYGSLKITKQDEDGTLVPNTSFKVSANSDMSSPIGTYTTGADGTVTITDLTPDTYYVQETAVPSHLVLDSTIHSVTVSPNQTAAFTANNNWKKGKVLIRKTDQDSGKQVAGATYAIYNASNDQEVARLTTLANGYASSDYLRFGNYYVKEVIAPNGYVLNNTKYPVTITENEQKIEVTGVDERVRGSIQIKKQDSVTGDSAQGEATLIGAKYGVYARENILDPADQSVKYQAGAKVAELTIGNDHTASVSNLYLGKYFIKEITPSDGYTLDTTEYDVTLSYQNQTTATVSVNQTVKERVNAQAFQIIKISVNGLGIADKVKGVEFTIKAQKDIEKYGSWEAAPIAKNAQGKDAAVLVTDENGYALSDELPYGTYIVRETKTPENLTPVPDFTVTISQDSRDPQPWQILNDTAIEVIAKLVKKDADSGKVIELADTTFKIKNLDTGAYVSYIEPNPTPHTVDSWTTTEDGYVYLGTTLRAGHYALVEITAPNGYVLNSEPVEFEVKGNGAFDETVNGYPVLTVEMSDQAVKGQILIEKRGEVLVGFEDGQFVYEERGLAGMEAEIIAAQDIMDPSNDGTVLYEKGSVVDHVTTKEDGKATSKLLPLGDYEIREVKAPQGYVLSDEVKQVSLTYQDQTADVVYSDVQTFTNARQKVSLSAQKLDEQIKQPLAGAQISLYANRKVYNYDGEVILEPNDLIQTVTTDDSGKAVFTVDLPLDLTPEYAVDLLNTKNLNAESNNNDFAYEGDPNSLWYVEESKAPHGYVSGEAFRYLFDTKYDEEAEELQTFFFTFTNEKTKVEITKTDVTGEQELAGAHLQVTDLNHNVIDEWISGEKAHVIERLHAGETYRLVETIAPQGYSVTNAIEFTVEDTAEIQQVVMKDELTHIQVQKVDENNKPLAGNVLAIMDAQGEIVEQWTSEETPHDVYGLIGGKEYTLKELHPAQGYSTAKEITFTVPTTANEVITITMSNHPVEMTFSKTDVTGEEELIGATLQVIDAETGSVIDEWVSKEEPHEIRYLVEGKEYILKEIIAPYGYEIANEISFTAKDGETIVMVDELILTDVQVNKVDSVTKEVIRSKDFAFTLYADEACTQAIETVHADKESGTATFKDLPYGVYFIKETAAPQGYLLSDLVYQVELNEHTAGIGQTTSIAVINEKIPSTTTGTQSQSGLPYLVVALISLSAFFQLIAHKRNHR